jgi:hypothetical protein
MEFIRAATDLRTCPVGKANNSLSVCLTSALAAHPQAGITPDLDGGDLDVDF